MNPYEELDYPTKPFRITRFDRMELLARLLGLEPVPAPAARVLEIGCGTGGNLMPEAEVFPGSQLVGIDLSASQIARGEALRAAAGLKNVRLVAMDLGDLDESWGQFDYIIAHGVYSWVDGAVKTRLLEVISQRLAENGVAYMSYNVKPGWFARGAVRDMMLHHTRHYEHPAEKVKHGRSMIQFLAAGARSNENAWRTILGQQAELVARMSDAEIFFDLFSDVNDACYFHELAARLPQVGLQYLCEVPFSAMVPDHIPADAVRALEKLGDDVIKREQYFDFLKNRVFRTSLLVRAGAPVSRKLELKRVLPWHIATRAETEEKAPDLDGPSPVTYKVGKGMATVSAPATKRAMADLMARNPGSRVFGEVIAEAGEHAAELAVELFRLFSYDIVELWPHADPFVVDPGERPRATSLARAMAARWPKVTNLRHESVQLDDAERKLVALLDGTRDRSDLGTALPGHDLHALLTGLARKALLI